MSEGTCTVQKNIAYVFLLFREPGRKKGSFGKGVFHFLEILDNNLDSGSRKRGGLRGGAVMTETAMTAETAKTVKPPQLPHCPVFCRTSKRRRRCSPEPPKPS